MLKVDEIQYVRDIVVLLHYNNKWFWYVSKKEFWIMDYLSFVHHFDEKNNDCSNRFNIPILNEDMIDVFIENMQPYKVELDIMKHIVEQNAFMTEWDAVAQIFPALYIDFHSKILYSVFQEYTNFEDYVPQGWKGLYENFYNIVPDSQKYWLINNKDYFELLT